MYTLEQIKNIVFFDLETASGHKNLDTLNQDNPNLASLWSKRCLYLRSKFEENRDAEGNDSMTTTSFICQLKRGQACEVVVRLE